MRNFDRDAVEGYAPVLFRMLNPPGVFECRGATLALILKKIMSNIGCLA
jgi:hypothetical protein